MTMIINIYIKGSVMEKMCKLFKPLSFRIVPLLLLQQYLETRTKKSNKNCNSKFKKRKTIHNFQNVNSFLFLNHRNKIVSVSYFT